MNPHSLTSSQCSTADRVELIEKYGVDVAESQIKKRKKKRLIGVENVGKKVNKGSYIIYNPDSDQLKFREINY